MVDLKSLEIDFQNFINKSVYIVPSLVPNEGSLGYVLFSNQNGSESSFPLYLQAYPKIKSEVECQDAELFVSQLKECVDKDRFIISSSNPLKLEVGFNVVFNSYCVRYFIKLSNLHRVPESSKTFNDLIQKVFDPLKDA